jgi:type IV secretion system protein TrbL
MALVLAALALLGWEYLGPASPTASCPAARSLAPERAAGTGLAAGGSVVAGAGLAAGSAGAARGSGTWIRDAGG